MTKEKTKTVKQDPVQAMLVKGETVLHEGRVHWGIFLMPCIYVFVGFLVGIFFHPWVGGLIFLLSLYPILNNTILYLTTRLVVSNKRVFARYGFFNRDVVQLRLDKIETAHLEQPFIGLILGYSTVVVRGTGTGAIPIPYIENGNVFVKAMQEYILDVEDAKGTGASSKSE